MWYYIGYHVQVVSKFAKIARLPREFYTNIQHSPEDSFIAHAWAHSKLKNGY